MTLLFLLAVVVLLAGGVLAALSFYTAWERVDSRWAWVGVGGVAVVLFGAYLFGLAYPWPSV